MTSPLTWAAERIAPIVVRLYYAFNRWRYGASYGCGRCHHAVGLHHKYAPYGPCEVRWCPCHEYSIGRVSW